MKIFVSILCLLIFAAGSLAQTGEILATANNQNFTVNDLPPQIGENYSRSAQLIKDLRTDLLSQQIASILLANEAKARNTTIEKLIETEVSAKIPVPSDAQIQAVFDANKDQIGTKSLTEVRPQIVAFLRQEPEQKGLAEYIAQLKSAHKVSFPKDVNAPLVQPTDVLAIVDGKQITGKDFEEKYGESIYEARMTIYDQTFEVLENTVLNALVAAEAKAQNVQPQDIFAREVTDKMKEFSDDERAKLEDDLANRLYKKYNAKFLLKEPAPFVQNIAVLPENPSRGRADAPVTVVMFSDFQCPACSATHPVLQNVLAEYGDRIRFVVRDYPLTQIHKNAYNAALAAAAAHAQGKFFEYTDILYKNQDKLDAASLKKYASDLGLNRQKFDADFDGKKFEAAIKKDVQDGDSYGVGGTPTIFVNGVKVNRLTADAFRKAIERALKK